MEDQTNSDRGMPGAAAAAPPTSPARARGRLTGFAVGEEGGMLVWSLFTTWGMLLAVGLGLTAQIFEMRRTHMQNTLDRAVLAATDLDQTLQGEDVIADYLTRAGLGDHLTSGEVDHGINFRTASAAAEVEMPTLFTVGRHSWNVTAESAAVESITDVEIALVLDNSGSMGWDDDYRLNLLKPAATAFVDTVARPVTPDSDGSVAISIVPFSTQVNAGPHLAGALDFSAEHAYSHCARFEAADYRTTALDPDAPIPRAGHFDIATWDAPVDTFGVVCPFDASRHITPWSTDKAALKAQIEAMWAGGNTSIDVATKWGVALLDPAFRPVASALAGAPGTGVDAALDGQPFDHGRDKTLKVLVVMSDGQNTDEFRLRSDYRSGASPVYRNPADGGYSYRYEYNGNTYYFSLDDRAWRWNPDGGDAAVRLSWPELFDEMSVAHYALYIKAQAIGGNWRTYYNEMFTWVPASEKNRRTSEICAAARDAGIVVYTIGMDTYGQGDATLEACAGTPVNFFDVRSVEIDQAFSAIAQQINELRLTQ